MAQNTNDLVIPNISKLLTFRLSFMETKQLLDQLWFCMSIKNRDIQLAKLLYEKIASQVNTIPVTVTIEDNK